MPSVTLGSGAASTVRRGLGVVARGAREQPRWFAVAVAGSLVYGVMTSGMAWAIGEVTADVITPAIARRSVGAGDLWRIGLTLSGVVLLMVIGIIGRRIGGGVMTYNLGADYRRRVTRQYLRLPLSWHHKHPSGQLLSNANADVEATWNIFFPLPMALGVIVMILVGLVQIVLIDPALAGIAVLVFPTLFVVNLAFQRAMSPRVTRAQQLRADVSEVAHESFDAALVVKSLGREDQEADRFSAVSHDLRHANVQVGRTRAMFDPVIDAIPTIGTLAVLLVGTARVSAGAITAAQVVQVAYLFSLLAFPVRSFGWVLGELPRSVVGWDRVSHVLSATGGMSYGDRDAVRVPASDLALSAVDFAYEIEDETGRPGRHPAVRGATLEVAPGRTVALVGPTGSGKSTLASLAVRLVDPDAGSIRLDGVELRQLRAGQVPEVAALVPQSTFMFDDTIRGNVDLRATATDEQVWAALALAHADVFVRKLPDGLDTRVGERGTSLSGGQRQRVALARAVVRTPQLLVLDDATSAVDPAVEQRILASLRQSAGETTVLIVAYRMATIALADEVVYLDRGAVIDRGSHEELLGRCRGYETLVTAYRREAAQRALLEDEAGDPFDDDLPAEDDLPSESESIR